MINTMTNEEVINGLGKIELVIYPDGTQVQEFVSYEKLILQALQEQRQSILKEIEKEITELESDLQGHMAYTAVERIKQLLKNN